MNYLSELVEKFRTKKNELLSLGGTVTEHELGRIILKQLPTKYDSLIVQLNREAITSTNGIHSLDEVFKAFESAANTMKEWEGEQGQASALVAKDQTTEKKSQKERRDQSATNAHREVTLTKIVETNRFVRNVKRRSHVQRL